MNEADQQNLTPEELAALEAEQLPPREQMSAIEPPLPFQPVGIDPVLGNYVPPETA